MTSFVAAIVHHSAMTLHHFGYRQSPQVRVLSSRCRSFVLVWCYCVGLVCLNEKVEVSPPHPDSLGLATSSFKSLRRRILIRNAAYMNFDFVAFLVTLVVCGVVILVNVLCLPNLAFRLHRKLGCSEFSRREWVEGHLLRLQGRLPQSKGIGTWRTGVDGYELTPATRDRGLTFSADRMWHEGRKSNANAPVTLC